MPTEPIYYRRPPRSNSGEILVLLHGFTGSSADWDDVLESWAGDYQIIAVDLRGHGKSGTLTGQFRHRDAAEDVLSLLDGLGVKSCKAIGISAGGNVLLHMTTKRPGLISAMVIVSATPYFPDQARSVMRSYGSDIQEAQRDYWKRSHSGGEHQIQALIASARGFADDDDDLAFTPPRLSRIKARVLIVQGDSDPLYPVDLSVDLAKAIPNASLWIVPQSGHGPVFGGKRPEFLRICREFLGC